MKIMKLTTGLMAVAASAGLMLATPAQADVQMAFDGNGFYLRGGSFAAGPWQSDNWLFQIIWHPTSDTGSPGPGASLAPGEVLVGGGLVSGSANGFYGYVGAYAAANFDGLYTDAAAGVALHTGIIFTRSFANQGGLGDPYFQSGGITPVQAPPPPGIPTINRIVVSERDQGNQVGGPAQMPIPEPSAVALILVGFSTILYRRRKQMAG